MTQEKVQPTLHTLSQHVLTKRNGKIILALAVVCVLAAGGGKYYLHQQHVAHYEQRLAAISQMVQAQASEHNVALISEDQAKADAAKALGQDESSLTFKEVALLDWDQMKHGGKEHGHRAKYGKHKEDRGGQPGRDEKGGRNNQPQGPAPQPGQSPQNGQSAPQADTASSAAKQPMPQAQRPFRPMYAIRATKGQVKYNVLLDAVTGNIIDSRVI